MKLYTTLIALFFFSALTLSVSAQDIKDGENQTPAKTGDNFDVKTVMRNYIRTSRVLSTSDIQNRSLRYSEDRFMQKLWLSLGIKTTGISIEAATPITEHFRLRAGIEYMPKMVSLKRKIAVKDDALMNSVQGDYYPHYKATFKPNFITGKVLLSYYPFKKGLHVTAGVYLGDIKFESKGHLINKATGEASVLKNGVSWPKLKLDGKYIVDIEDGNLDVKVKQASPVKPYLGFGYEFTFGQDGRWGINVEAGATYGGGIKIYQFGKEAPKASDQYVHKSNAINIESYKNWTRFWPSAGVHVSYRIF